MAASSVKKEIGDYLVDLDLDNLLGKGTYGQVFMGEHVRTGRNVAVKLLQADKQFVTKDTDIEARAMMAIPDHENVLKIYDLIKKEVIKRRIYINFYLVLEYCPLGSLVDYAAQNSMSLTDKLDLMLQGNLGIRHLHHIKPKCFIHRDIKPSNMLIAGDSNKVVLKIGDFGEVKIIEKSKIMESIRGTQSYWAPEMFSLSVSNANPNYNKSVDVFSKGMSDLALLDCGDKSVIKAKKLHDEDLGLYLCRHKDETVQYSVEQDTDTDDVKDVKQLIKLMIAQKASDRPSIQEVVETLNYLLTTLSAKILREKPPALLKKVTAGRGEASGAQAGSTGGASSRANQAEAIDGRPATRDVLVAVDVNVNQAKRALWLLTGSKWEGHPIPEALPQLDVCFCTMHGGIAAIGGIGADTTSAKCHFFSLVDKRWTELADMITARSGASAVEIRENVVMVMGGRDSKDNEILDGNLGEWMPVESIAASNFPLVAVLAGCVYILPRDAKKSGVFKTKYLRNLQEHNTLNEIIAPKASLVHSRRSESLGLVALAGKLYFFTVDEEGSDRGHCSQYDPVSDVWSVQETRYPLSYRWPLHCAAVVKDKKILLCGGDQSRTAVVEYSFEPNKWRILSTRLCFRYDRFISYIGTAKVRV